MADEIKLTASVIAENGPFLFKFTPGQQTVTQSNPGRGGHAQVIGTTPELIDFGDITTAGIATFRNLDDTNFVTIGPEIGTSGVMQAALRLKAGEGFPVRLEPNVNWYGQADTASVKLDINVLED